MDKKARNIADLQIAAFFLAVILLCAVVGGGISLLPETDMQRNIGWCLVGISVGLGLVWIIFRLLKRLSELLNLCLVWGAGACLRLGFILRMPFWRMQHDVWSFTGEMDDNGCIKGHAGYMMYLFQNGHLPNVDVRTVWQYYHPPLHHTLCALWMHLMSALGLKDDALYESIQVMPFIWSCLALAAFALILRELGLRGDALALPLALMAVHPQFIILSGSINNDMLSICLMLIALLFTIRWYKEPNMRHIIPLALAIGFGMMAKLSAWIAAPAAAIVFIVVFVRNIRKPLPYLAQYGVFLLLCCPLALWWEIRNAIRWGVPFTYIPMLSNSSNQYVGFHSVWDRLFNFSPYQFTFIYDCYLGDGRAYSEFNPLVGLFKTAMFDEYVNTEHTPAVAGFGDALFWMQVILALLALVLMVWMLFRSKERLPLRIGLFATWAVTVLSYYSFCLTFAHTCTQSARYATPAIYIPLIFLGLWSRDCKNGRTAAVLRGVTVGISAVFILLSAAVYGVLIFWES